MCLDERKSLKPRNIRNHFNGGITRQPNGISHLARSSSHYDSSIGGNSSEKSAKDKKLAEPHSNIIVNRLYDASETHAKRQECSSSNTMICHFPTSELLYIDCDDAAKEHVTSNSRCANNPSYGILYDLQPNAQQSVEVTFCDAQVAALMHHRHVKGLSYSLYNFSQQIAEGMVRVNYPEFNCSLMKSVRRVNKTPQWDCSQIAI